jgi:hypothetical protein
MRLVAPSARFGASLGDCCGCALLSLAACALERAADCMAGSSDPQTH